MAQTLEERFIERTSDLAKGAGVLAVTTIGEKFEEHYKEVEKGRTLQTYPDKILDEFFIRGVQKIFPRIEILSEESGIVMPRSEDIDKKYKIQIDGLDGSRNHREGGIDFAHSLALINCETNQPDAGVVYLPLVIHKDGRNCAKLYTAIRGKCSLLEVTYANKKPEKPIELKVSDTKSITNSVLLVSEYHPGEILNLLNKFPEFKEVVPVGSGAKKICMLADPTERGDVYMQFDKKRDLSEWDTSAAELILIGAGGKVTDMLGNPIPYNKENPSHKEGYLGSNGNFHDELVDLNTKFLIGKN